MFPTILLIFLSLNTLVGQREKYYLYDNPTKARLIFETGVIRGQTYSPSDIHHNGLSIAYVRKIHNFFEAGLRYATFSNTTRYYSQSEKVAYNQFMFSLILSPFHTKRMKLYGEMSFGMQSINYEDKNSTVYFTEYFTGQLMIGVNYGVTDDLQLQFAYGKSNFATLSAGISWVPSSKHQKTSNK